SAMPLPLQAIHVPPTAPCAVALQHEVRAKAATLQNPPAQADRTPHRLAQARLGAASRDPSIPAISRPSPRPPPGLDCVRTNILAQAPGGGSSGTRILTGVKNRTT